MSIQDCLSKIKMDPKDKSAIEKRIKEEITEGMSDAEIESAQNRIITELLDQTASDLNNVAVRAEDAGVAATRIHLPHTEVIKRIPQLTQAAKDLTEGTITKDDYRALVERYKPVLPFETAPEPATLEDMQTALNKRQQKDIDAPVEDGEMVGLRLDIPAYSKNGTWVVSVHKDKGKSYRNTAVVTAPEGGKIEFRNRVKIKGEEFPIVYARGDSSKVPVATIDGAFKNESADVTYERAQAALNSPDWIQVGYDPERSNLFYHRDTMAPVYSAEEVIQIGPLVLARNAELGEFQDPQVLFESALIKEEGYEALNMMSKVERAILRMNVQAWTPSKKNPEGRALAGDIYNKLRKENGVKPEELNWAGSFVELLMQDQKARYTREEVHNLFINNKVSVFEEILGELIPTKLKHQSEEFKFLGATVDVLPELQNTIPSRLSSDLQERYGYVSQLNRVKFKNTMTMEFNGRQIAVEPMDIREDVDALSENDFKEQYFQAIEMLRRMFATDPAMRSQFMLSAANNYISDPTLSDALDLNGGYIHIHHEMNADEVVYAYLNALSQNYVALESRLADGFSKTGRRIQQARLARELGGLYSTVYEDFNKLESTVKAPREIDILTRYGKQKLWTEDHIQEQIAEQIKGLTDKPIERQILEFAQPDEDGWTTNYTAIGNEDVGYYVQEIPLDEMGLFPTIDAIVDKAQKAMAIRASKPKPTRHEQWLSEFTSIEGYSEILIRLDDNSRSFTHTEHFPEKNVLAFIRATNRHFDKGEKISSFHMDEIQSDWHQQGSSLGYFDDRTNPANFASHESTQVKKINDDLREMKENMELAVLDYYASANESTVSMKRIANRMGYLTEDERSKLIQDIEQGGDGSRNAIKQLFEMSREPISSYDTYRIDSAISIYYKGLASGSNIDEGHIIAKDDVELLGNSDYWSLLLGAGQYDQLRKYRQRLQDHAVAVKKWNDQKPDAPFKKEGWLRLGLKRAVAHATDLGVDHVTWGNSRHHVDDWSGTYNNGYQLIYDQALPKVANDLGFEVIMLDDEGNPVDDFWDGSEISVPPLDNFFEVKAKESDGLYYVTYRKNLQDSVMYPYQVLDRDYGFATMADAVAMGIQLHKRAKPIKGSGVFAIKISEEVAEQVADGELSLFQNKPPVDRVNQKAENRGTLKNATRIANKKKYATNRELKVALQESVQQAAEGGANPAEMTEAALRNVIRVGIKDAKQALQENANAVGWYDERVSKAIATMGLIHPELNTDPKSKVAFTWALAVTSNGAKVDKNFELTEKAYAYWKKHGKMPTNIGIGKPAKQINESMKAYNELVEIMGHETLEKFMDSKFTVAQLKSLGYKITDELATETVRGSAILGAKIGNGFYSNLRGKFDALTMDRWLMATWGRWTGNLIGDYSKAIGEKETKLVKSIQTFEKRSPKKLEEFSKLIGIDMLSGNPTEVALAIWKSSQKPENRAVMNKTKIGEELRKLGNGITDLRDGQLLSPQNSTQRAFIRKAFTGILQDAQKTEPNLTMADLQALLWYAEKTLYANAKSDDVVDNFADDEAPDYANAARDVAVSQGISLDDIAETWRQIDENRKLKSSGGISGDGSVQSSGVQEESGGFDRKERGQYLLRNIFTPDRIGRGNNEKPQPYKRTGRKRDLEVRGLEAIWSVASNYQKVAELSEIGAQDYLELTPTPENAKKFFNAIKKSKAGSEYGAAVYVYTKPEYQKMRMFMNESGDAGFAIKEDGDIVSVFTGGGAHAYSLIHLAVQAGGKKLDAFDTVLPKIYGAMGFVEVGRDSWNEKYKPEGWNKETFSLYNNGEPDVVYMEYQNADPYANSYNQPDNDNVNEARGNILFQGDRALITLFNASDRSTFMHEAGHLFLEMERRMADPTNLTEDQQKILNFLEVDSFADIGVEEHEKWARGFERYIMEGKAPSNALKDAFAFMSKWLTDIYRRFKNLNVELDDDIRGVMDRMLATDEEIAQASMTGEYDEFFKDAESAGMTEAEYEAYKKRVAKSKRKGEETLREKLMNEITRKTKSWWNKEKKALVDHHKVALQEQPFYEMLANLQGELNETADNKINRDSFVEAYGERVPISMERYLSNESLVTADDMSQVYGYDSTETMISDFKNKPPLNVRATQIANKEMLDKHGDILNDGTIEMEVDMAMRNEDRAELLLFELKMLYRKARRTPDIDRVAIKQQAVELIRNTPVRKLAPYKYRRAEVKYAKKSQKAMDEGRTEDAIQAKKLQVINQHLFKEATDAQGKADKLARRMQKIKKRKYDPKNINMQHAINAQLLLSAYDFRVNNKESADIAMERAQRVANWVASQDSDYAPIIALDPQLRKIIDGEDVTLKPRQEMTLMEMQDLSDQVEHILHVGRMLSDSDKAKLSKHYQKIADSIRENATQPKDNVASQLMDEYSNQIFLHADSVARKLDGNADGIVINEVKRPIDEAVTEKLIPMKEKSGEEIQELYERFFSAGDMRRMNKKITIPHLNRSMSKWEIISLALNWGNESSRQAVLESMNRGELMFPNGQADVTQIFDLHMTKNDWDFVQSTWDYINSYWPALSRIEQNRTGVTPQKVNPIPFETPHGEYRGGYYPLKYDSKGSVRVREEDVNNIMKGNQAGRFAKASTPDGMLIERQGSGGRPVLFDMSVFHSHIAQTIHVIALSEPVAQVQGVLASAEVKEAMEQTGNTEALQSLDVWLKDVAAGEVASQLWLEKLARHIRTGFSSIALGWNVGTMLLQPLGIMQSMPVVGFNRSITNMMKFMVNWKSMIQEAMDQSAFMRERGYGFNKDIQDVMANIDMGNSKQSLFASFPRLPASVKRTFFGGIVFFQRMVDVVTWHAGLQKYMAENNIELNDAKGMKDARYFADRAVARSQSSGTQSDKTTIERGTIGASVRQTELVRIWTTLGSYFFAKGNIIAERTRETQFTDPVQLAMWVRDMMLLTVIEGMVIAWIRNTAPEEDDDESYAAFVASESLKTAIGSYPFFRLLGSEASGFRGGSVITSGSEIAGKGVTSLTNVIESMWNEDVEIKDTDIKRINDVLGMGFKYPSKAVYRAGEALYRDIEGEDVESLDYLIYRKEEE